MAKRFSTSTETHEGRWVPWLAADGPLAYSPDAPPPRDYFFHYGWVLPGIFSPDGRRHRPYPFGAQRPYDAEELFAFWRAARNRDVETVWIQEGQRTLAHLEAPIAIYRWSHNGKERFLLLQHGSYQCVAVADQPLLQKGIARLYRGIGTAAWFKTPPARLPQKVQRTLFDVQASVLRDSVASFNSVHDRVKRCETGHLRDESWVTNTLAQQAGLVLEGAAARLWRACHQSFSLARWVAEMKFGPHFAICETPVSNLRLTTLFAGEHEVRLVNPCLVRFVETVGCEVKASKTLAGLALAATPTQPIRDGSNLPELLFGAREW